MLILAFGLCYSLSAQDVGLRLPNLTFSTQFPLLQAPPYQKSNQAVNPVATSTSLAPIAQPSIYRLEHLAFFCRIEVELEKATRFPVKFRLGDVQYVDWLEGKTE